MSHSPRRSLKRAVAGVSAGMLAFTGFAAFAASADAATGFSFTRLAGINRFATAATIATTTFTTADTVLIANGESGHYPDALAGNYLAGQTHSPILLTGAGAALPAETVAAITALHATKAIIMGGTDAVSADVQSQLSGMSLTVSRLGGLTRYDTAKLIAEAPGAGAVGSATGQGPTAILANGANFPDALTAGPLSYVKSFPILLTDPAASGLSPQTSQVITDLGIKHVLIAGGTSAVTAAAESALGAAGVSAERLAGNTRQDTAVAIANYETANGFNNTHINLARGDAFPDALAGGPHGGQDMSPILLTDSTCSLGDPADTYLKAHSATLTSGHVFGGTAAICDAVVAQATADATGTAVPAKATVTIDTPTIAPGQNITGTIAAVNANNDVVSATVSGSCVASGNVADTNTGLDGIQFSIPSLAASADGACALTFVTTFADGTTETETASVTIAAPTGPHGITVNNPSVPNGGTVSGTIAAAGTVASVTVSGCGLNSANVPILPNGGFFVNIPAGQAAGDCVLTFTVRASDGTVTTQQVPVTITAAPATATAGPDLISATIDTTNNTVVYTFDEAIASLNGSNCTNQPPGATTIAVGCEGFHLYNAATGASQSPSQAFASGNTVIAQYTAAQTAVGTVATVDQGVVQDAVGRVNPICDAPVQPATQNAGVTDEPDLLSVNNERTVLGQPAFDFTFDAPIAHNGNNLTGGPTNNTGNDAHDFAVIDTSNNAFNGTNILGVSADGRTVTVGFPLLVTNGVPVSEVVRGSALSTATSAANGGTGNAAVYGLSGASMGNPLETEINTSANATAAAAAAATGQTNGPDLIAVQVIAANTIRYTFDQPVAGIVPGDFLVYDYNGNEARGQSAAPVNGNAAAVDVTFAANGFGQPVLPAGFVASAVGASVTDVAVTATTGTNDFNQEAELPLELRGFAAGRTVLPDLVGVTKSVDAFGNTKVVYSFDDTLPNAAQNRRFYYLYDAGNGVFQPTTNGVVLNTPAAHTVTFTNAFSAAVLNAAVEGSVDANGFGYTSGPPPVYPADQFPIFPEGCSPITAG